MSLTGFNRARRAAEAAAEKPPQPLLETAAGPVEVPSHSDPLAEGDLGHSPPPDEVPPAAEEPEPAQLSPEIVFAVKRRAELEAMVATEKDGRKSRSVLFGLAKHCGARVAVSLTTTALIDAIVDAEQQQIAVPAAGPDEAA